MRSAREILFRLHQEAANLRLLTLPPSLVALEAGPLPLLPDAGPVIEQLRGSGFSREIEEIARGILAHRFPILGLTVETGPEVDWHRDYLNGITSANGYSRFIPYLDASRVGDHKIIWELNRHQHLVVLAQAFRFTGRAEFLSELLAQLESWLAANPFLRGINWVSALEVAFRAVSWVWVYHLAGAWMPATLRPRFLTALYRHGCYLERNLSVYFSPNTHLLGEAVALHALAVLFPWFPHAGRWKKLAVQLVCEQMDFQVREDGSHFEQSTYYHVYALDLFLFHQILGNPPQPFRQKLRRMAEYLAALMGPAGRLPFLGDDDGGRLVHPYGARDRFGRATLATCASLFHEAIGSWHTEDRFFQAAWWLGVEALSPSVNAPQPASRWFPQAGVAIAAEGSLHAIVDAGPFGLGSAGHSHADTLSLTVYSGDAPLLIDPGTFTYVGDIHLRNWFRGTAAHNTVRIDGIDQAIPAGPFCWRNRPDVELLTWSSNERQDMLDARCRYAGFTHRRRVLFRKPALFLVLDEIDGPEGEHQLEQFWHAGAAITTLAPHYFRIGEQARLGFPVGENISLYQGGEHGWCSPTFGVREESPVLIVARQTTLPAAFATVLDCSGGEEMPVLECERSDRGFSLRLQGLVVFE